MFPVEQACSGHQPDGDFSCSTHLSAVLTKEGKGNGKGRRKQNILPFLWVATLFLGGQGTENSGKGPDNVNYYNLLFPFSLGSQRQEAVPVAAIEYQHVTDWKGTGKQELQLEGMQGV